MNIELRWIASLSASCLYATSALLRGEKLLHEALSKSLSEPAHLLAELVGAGEPDGQQCCDHLVALAGDIENNYQLAETVLIKTRGVDRFGEPLKNEMAGCISAMESAFRKALPSVVEELATRGKPLRAQWEARGPGLLTCVGGFTEPGLMVGRAEVVLVYPVCGGGGRAHLPYNTVNIEAVLVDPCEEFPEVVRLGWLLSQLNLDVPIYGELVPGRRLPRVAALAMITPVLAAAEQVELVRFDRGILERAIRAWCPRESDPRALAEVLDLWWQTYVSTQPRWNAALAALDRMLEDENLDSH